MVGIRRLLLNLIDIEGRDQKRVPYRGRKIVQRPAPDLDNWTAASVSLWKSPCNCSSSWRLDGGLQLYWMGIPQTTAQNDKSIAHSRLVSVRKLDKTIIFSKNLVFTFFPAVKKKPKL